MAEQHLRRIQRVNYDRSMLSSDLIAGITLWCVFTAQALAYSRLAHASPSAGLVTGVAGAGVYALLGSSRKISIGPAGGIAAIVGDAVAHVPSEHLVSSLAVLTLLSAAFLFIAGLLRVSILHRLFPVPVFIGYLAGTGVIILLGQIKDLHAGGPSALIIGAACFAAVLLLQRLMPRIPGPFVVLIAITLLSVALGFEDRGIAVIGASAGKFGAPIFPGGLSRDQIAGLILPACGLGLLVYIDGLANAEMLATKTDPPIRPRREYFALGAANLVSGLFGGFTGGCSSSRSLVGIRSGERTKLAGGIAAVLLLLTGFSIVRFLHPVPLAALAGVVCAAAIGLIDVKRLRELFAFRRADLWIALAALAGVVVAGPVKGIAIGVIVALVEAFRRAMYPERTMFAKGNSAHTLYQPFVPHALPIVDGVAIYRFGAPLFFGNADVFWADMEQIARQADPALRTLVINSDALGIPDATARDALLRARNALREKGIALVFGNARRELRSALTKTHDLELIEEREFIDDLKKLNPSLG